MKRIITLVVMLSMSVANLVGQGSTTSSINGYVEDPDGERLIGVNISAVHEPTGTLYGTATDDEGLYRIDNMRVGGPYTITISYIGYQEVRIEEVVLRLGEPFRQNITIGEMGLELDEIVVMGRGGSVGENSGTSTQIGTEEIESIPTLNRNIEDYTRLTPSANNAGEGTSFGGVNNRYNAIYVDGAVNNDVFGLAASGTNGGQTGISPFSIDIIDQFQVVLSPYDVTYGGFAGAGINAVTKSGTNNFEGTAYYFMQNENLVGKTNKTFADEIGLDDRTKVSEFNQQTYGLSLGGPIVKDKVFFFTNVELQNDVTPSPFNFEEYEGGMRSSREDIENLRDHLINTYDYNPGTFGDVDDELEGLKLFGKIDVNLSEKHKLTLRHQYTKAEEFDRNAGDSDEINFSNNGIFFPSITNSSALELNSNFGSTMSNNLIIGYTTVNDDRDPLGDPFPHVIIFDDNGEIQFGSEQFSTANVLDQKIFTITDNFKLYRGKHTWTFGTHNEFYDIRNVFMPWNYGEYEFESIDDFINGEPAVGYTRVYSLVDDVAGDDTDAAADFKAMQLGVYVQDEIALSNRFTLTAGLRLDVPILADDPEEAPRFNDQVLPRLFEDYPEFEGDVAAGEAPDGQLMLSPRLGFNYEIDNKSTLRGGVGLFTSRIPFVWPGAMYNTNGLTSTFLGEWGISGDVNFRPDIQNQYTFENPTVPSGDMNLFTKDFKYPQVLRGNIGYDIELGDGWFTTVEGIYTKTINNVKYTNINTSSEVMANFTGSGDDRPIFANEEIDEDDFGAVYLGSNTDQGYTYNFTASINKTFIKSFNVYAAFSYGDAFALFEGTSSQNSSQWRGAINIDGRNNAEYGRSDFALGSRLITSLTYSHEWNANLKTTISLFYNGQSGQPMSYVIGGDRDARNLNNERGSTSRWRSLVYVPMDQNDINLVDYQDGGTTVTAEEQWENLNALIKEDDHLSDRRGDYAEKNGARAPWENMFDLAIRQDIGTNIGGKMHKLQLSLDIFNVANLINSDWGVRYDIPGDFNNYELLNFEGFDFDGTTPLYTYRETETDNSRFDYQDFSSRWRMRVGLRYIFK